MQISVVNVRTGFSWLELSNTAETKCSFWVLLVYFAPSPAFSSSGIFVFFIERLTPGWESLEGVRGLVGTPSHTRTGPASTPPSRSVPPDHWSIEVLNGPTPATAAAIDVTCCRSRTIHIELQGMRQPSHVTRSRQAFNVREVVSYNPEPSAAWYEPAGRRCSIARKYRSSRFFFMRSGPGPSHQS